ncbi:MAG: lytic transglycosylase domain-containing protein [Patescibacteria group bacterium]|jgi:hypothetical protein|nr:lytic transglycosylase domain-containing protein [Patescibacteria group bacterium]
MNENFNIKPKSVEEQESSNANKGITRRGFVKGLVGFAITGAVGKTVGDFFEDGEKNKGEKTENITKEEILKEVGVEENDINENVSREEEGELSQEQIDLKKLTKLFMEKYQELSCKHKFFPKEIFHDDFFIATQLQESGYKTDAESHKGAVGSMQNMAISIVDVVRGLNLLKRRGEIEFEIEGLKKEDELEPEKLKKAINPKRIQEMIAKDQNLSRALGKLYFMMLHGVYEVDENEYGKGNYKDAQEKLLACYNGGTKQKDREKHEWPPESRNYVEKIGNYMQRLTNIKDEMDSKGILTNDNYTRMIIARKMDDPRISKTKYSALNNFLIQIKEEEDIVNGKVGYDKIKSIINI